MSSSLFREIILDHLSPDRWKTAKDICDEIEEQWEREQKRFLLIFPKRPQVAKVWKILEELNGESAVEAILFLKNNEKRTGWKLMQAGKTKPAGTTSQENAELGPLVA